MIPWRPTLKLRELAIFMALVEEAQRCAREGERWPGLDQYHPHIASRGADRIIEVK